MHAGAAAAAGCVKRAAAADAMGKAETLALARAMLRMARRFSDYNFRE